MIAVTVNSVENRKRVRMRVRMHPAPIQCHPRRPLSRKTRVARDLHISPAAADKLLYGPKAANRLYTAIITSDVRAADLDAVASWIAPAESALAALPSDDADDLLRLLDLSIAWWSALHADLGLRPVISYTAAELETALRIAARVHLAVTRAMKMLDLLRSERGSR